MCALFLQSDPLLWEYMTKPVASGGKGYVRTVHVFIMYHLIVLTLEQCPQVPNIE